MIDRAARRPTTTTGLSGEDPTRPATAWVRWAAGGALACLAVAMLLVVDVPPLDLVRFVAYWCLGVIVPGVVVLRYLRGPGARLLEDLGLGAATGLAIEMLVAVALSLVRLDAWAPWWPLVVYAALASSARLRQAVGPRPYRAHETSAQAWSLAATGAIVVAGSVPVLRRMPLPPLETTANIDRWWHAGLVEEMLKPGLPVDPRVAGELSVYHWFSHLHLAVGSATSGVEPTTVYFRLWIVPVVLVGLALVATLGRHVTRRAWGGPLAAWMTFVALDGGTLWQSRDVPGAQPVSFSPSQMLSLVLVGAAAIAIVHVCRDPTARRECAWLGLLLLGSVGIKPTAIPVLLSGTLLATVASSVVRRRLDVRLTGLSLVLLVLTIVMMLVSATPGKLTVLGTLESLRPYAELIAGGGPRATDPAFMLSSLDSPRAWTVAIATIVLVVAGNGLRVLGLATLAHRATRRDPVSWWLAGAYLSGWAAFLVVDHPSRSQFFFLGTVAIFGSVLFALLATTATPRGTRGGRVVCMVLLGGLLGWIARSAPGWAADGAPDQLDRIWIPLAVAASGIALGTIAVHLVDRRKGRAGTALLTVVFLSLGLTIPSTVGHLVGVVRRASPTIEASVDRDALDYLTTEEQEAALWLRDHSDPLDVVATNLHCRSKQETSPGCDARGFWLSGLSGRRVLLEGWAYRPETHAHHGDDGRAYPYQPAPWPDRFELSQAAITDPSAEVMAELRDRGVDWLVGVRRAGDVSPRIGEFAEQRFANEQVAIYELVP